MDFFRDCSAADDLAPLKHERFQAGFGQIAGRDQPIVATADDDDVVSWHARKRRQFKTNSAADFHGWTRIKNENEIKNLSRPLLSALSDARLSV
jgi:hypothetical protein